MTTADETDDSSNVGGSSTQGYNVQDQKSDIRTAESIQYSHSNPHQTENDSQQNNVGLLKFMLPNSDPSHITSDLHAMPDVQQEILEHTDVGAFLPAAIPEMSVFSSLSNSPSFIGELTEITSPPPPPVSQATMPHFETPCLDQKNVVLYPVHVRSSPVSSDRTLYIVTYEIRPSMQNFVPPLLYPQVSESTGKIHLLPEISEIDCANLNLETPPFTQNFVSPPPHPQVPECDQKEQLLPHMSNIDFNNPNFETEPSIQNFEPPLLHQEISECTPEIELSPQVPNVDYANLKFEPQNLIPSFENCQGSKNCAVIKNLIETEVAYTRDSPTCIKLASTLENIKLEKLDLPSSPLQEMDVHLNSHGESNSTSNASSSHENQSQEQDSLPASPFDQSLQEALGMDELLFFEAESTETSCSDPLGDKTRQFDGIPENSCPFPNCCKVFKQKCHLERHMKGHTGKKDYECSHCDKKFVRRDHWSNHVKIHLHGLPVRVLICPIPYCRKVYKRTGHLNRHLKGHDGKKNFHCSHCNKRFARKDYLREHIQLHFPSKYANRRRYSCNMPGCDKRFVQSGHLARHMKSHVKVIVCHYCNEKFTRKENLPRHFERKHANEI